MKSIGDDLILVLDSYSTLASHIIVWHHSSSNASNSMAAAVQFQTKQHYFIWL